MMDEGVQIGRELSPQEFAELRAEQEEAARVAAIVAEWGPSFEAVAKHPRIVFEDAKVFLLLWKPVRVGTAVVPRLAFEEPTLEHMTALDRVQGDTMKARRLLMQVCGMTEKETGAVGTRDMVLVGMIMEAFTGPARAIGV